MCIRYLKIHSLVSMCLEVMDKNREILYWFIFSTIWHFIYFLVNVKTAANSHTYVLIFFYYLLNWMFMNGFLCELLIRFFKKESLWRWWVIDFFFIKWKGVSEWVYQIEIQRFYKNSDSFHRLLASCYRISVS